MCRWKNIEHYNIQGEELLIYDIHNLSIPDLNLEQQILKLILKLASFQVCICAKINKKQNLTTQANYQTDELKQLVLERQNNSNRLLFPNQFQKCQVNQEYTNQVKIYTGKSTKLWITYNFDLSSQVYYNFSSVVISKIFFRMIYSQKKILYLGILYSQANKVALSVQTFKECIIEGNSNQKVFIPFFFN
ncbi:unnamed protein product [Paramecium sonneborni]|uniref:Uncharacterized protein n=1 Tax=Paramecium sonneborni TaxID=65129 RepID=A0A8S1RPZ2_9CILI|nr:unnamed protein product [Paramecium sonneborni]